MPWLRIVMAICGWEQRSVWWSTVQSSQCRSGPTAPLQSDRPARTNARGWPASCRQPLRAVGWQGRCRSEHSQWRIPVSNGNRWVSRSSEDGLDEVDVESPESIRAVRSFCLGWTALSVLHHRIRFDRSISWNTRARRSSVIYALNRQQARRVFTLYKSKDYLHLTTPETGAILHVGGPGGGAGKL